MKINTKFEVKEISVEFKEADVKFGGLNGAVETEVEVREIAANGDILMKLMDKIPDMFREMSKTLVEQINQHDLNEVEVDKAKFTLDKERDAHKRKMEEARYHEQMALEQQREKTAAAEKEAHKAFKDSVNPK